MVYIQWLKRFWNHIPATVTNLDPCKLCVTDLATMVAFCESLNQSSPSHLGVMARRTGPGSFEVARVRHISFSRAYVVVSRS